MSTPTIESNQKQCKVSIAIILIIDEVIYLFISFEFLPDKPRK